MEAMPAPNGEAASAVVAIGMSAGALETLRTMVQAFSSELSAAIVIAHHVAAPSVLPLLLQRWGAARAQFAARGMRLHRGGVYVCPPLHHIVVNPDGTLDVSTRERLDYVRPSIDWLFESVAASLGDRAIAVVLSGANADGARGARAVRKAGGRVLVEDPSTAVYSEMPRASSYVAHAELHPCELGPVIERELARIERDGGPMSWGDCDA